MKENNRYKKLKATFVKGMAMGVSLSLFIPCVNSAMVYGAENDVEDSKIKTVADSVYEKDRLIDDETLLDITEEVEIVTEENEETFSNFEDLLNQYEEYLNLEAAKAIDEMEDRIDDEEINAALVKREFINRLGADYLNEFRDRDTSYGKFISFIMEDNNLLTAFLQARPDLDQDKLRRALEIWKEIWDKDEDAHDGFYAKLAIATALAHAKTVKTWDYDNKVVDPLKRYEHYKQLNEDGKLFDTFENYDVTHLSMIVNTMSSEDDIDWMQSFIRTKRPDLMRQNKIKSAAFCVPYRKYNQDGVSVFKGTTAYYGVGWTLKDVQSTGGVCGSLSHFGTQACQAFGVPATLVGQPGHSAFLYMESQDSWQIGNNITGFGKSKVNGRSTMPWGKHPAYILLLEDAYQDKADLEKSQKLCWLTEVIDSSEDQLNLIDQAIEIQPLNYFAWNDKINHLLDQGASNREWEKLKSEIIATFSKHPKVMMDLLNKFEDHILTDNRVDMQQYIIELHEAFEEVTDKRQASVISEAKKQMINKGLYLAQFSFDGENAGRLMGIKTDVEYSLDGGDTFKGATQNDLLLTDNEIKNITAQDDILLRIKGTQNSILLPIKTSELKERTIKADDTLNTLTGLKEGMEFRVDGKETWIRYTGDNLPDLSGNITIHVRKTATGTYLPSNIITRKFTAVTFSFDGKYAGKLMGSTPNTEYSLDGGVTYKTATENDMSLSEEELKSITAQDGMLIRIKGTEDTQLIRFKTQGLWQSTIKGNDELNTLTGLRNTMEFSIDDKKTWTRYNGNNLPDLTGNITIHVRKAAKGTYLPGSIVTRKFTGIGKIVSASFSFDGENRGRLIGVTPDAEYSLDGGGVYKNVTEEDMLLSEEEINSITAENGILLRIKGAKDTFLIAIEEGILSEGDIEADDSLNTLIGIDATMAFKVDDQKNWIRFAGDNLPDLAGNKTIYIRKVATGTKLPSNVINRKFTSPVKIDSIRFSFDGQNKDRLMGANSDVEYSLDTGKSYKSVTEENMLLSEDAINSITTEDGILLRIKGTEDTYLISIQKKILHTRLIKANDTLNTLTGIRDVMEFSVDDQKTWTRYNGKNLPDLSGNVTIHIRKVATGTGLPSNIVTRKFTD